MTTPTQASVRVQIPAMVLLVYRAINTAMALPNTVLTPGTMLRRVDSSVVNPKPAMIVGPISYEKSQHRVSVARKEYVY